MMTKIRHHKATAKALLIILFLILACGFEGYFYEQRLENLYSVIAIDNYETACISKRDTSSVNSVSCVVGWMVYSYGWDDRYIIAKQHPEKDDSGIDLTQTNWFIIDTLNDTVYGPMSEGEFFQKRETLGVPKRLDFIVTFDEEGITQ